MVFSLLTIIFVFLCCTCLQNNRFQIIWLFVFCLFVCFLNFLYVLSFRPDNCLFPHSLSVIVLFFLFFRCRSSPEISKNIQGIPGRVPLRWTQLMPVLSFQGMWIIWLWDLLLGCGLKKSDLGETPFLHGWPPIRLMLFGQRWLYGPPNWAYFPLGALAYDLKLMSQLWPRKAHQTTASASKLKFSHFGCCL